MYVPPRRWVTRFVPAGLSSPAKTQTMIVHSEPMAGGRNLVLPRRLHQRAGRQPHQRGGLYAWVIAFRFAIDYPSDFLTASFSTRIIHCVMNSFLHVAGDLGYRLHITPAPSEVPDHRLTMLVEGPERLTPGRALDLGCATGRNAIYLAQRGWETVGVEMAGSALDVARKKAADHAVSVRFVNGDVTQLADLDIGADFTLLMDGGCYHMIPPSRRHDYVTSITRVAACGARLILVGFRRGLGVRDEADLVTRFPGWRLIQVGRVPGEQMCQYISSPAPLRAALKRGALHPLRYELERNRADALH
jgi:SAM-dependent methyltransferase